MISNFNIVMMYVIGMLEILLPLTVFYIFYRYKKFSISSIIAGFACYFIITSMLVNGIISMILVAIKDPFFFNDNALLGLTVESAMTALLLTPVLYLILRKVRRGKWSLYDAAGMSVGYWVAPLFSNAAIMVSQASLARQANKGNLINYVNEEYPIEALESLVASLADISGLEMMGQFVTVLVSQTVILMVAVGLGFIVYYAAKRQKVSMLLLSILVNFVYMMVMFGAEHIVGYWGSFAVVVLVGIGAFFFIRGFLRFYRRQQAELIRKKQEYKAELRAKAAAEREAKQAEKNA